MPATIVGRAKGRSITELTIALPGKLSRTSTQAITVPITALIATTISEAIRVSFSAAIASGLVIAVQNAPIPPSVDFAVSAASGIRTMRLKYAVTRPRPSAAPPRRGTKASLGDAAWVPETALTPSPPPGLSGRPASLGRDPQILLYLRDDALLRIEEVGVHLVPAAEVVDRELAGRGWELVLVLVEHGLDHRAVAGVRPELLCLGRVQVLHEVLSLRRRVRGGRDRRLDQDRVVGDDVVHVLARLLGGDRLVLVGEENVALAVHERVQGVAGAGVLHRRLREQLLEVRLRLLRCLALVDLGAVGGHQVPLRAAGLERVRRHHLEVLARDVVPALDFLGVALADHEDDHRVLDVAVVGVLVPVLGNLARVHNPLHVGVEREMDDVGRLARLDGPRLVAGARERGGERRAVALRGLLEGGNQLVGVDALRGGVGDEADLAAARATARGDGDAEREGQPEGAYKLGPLGGVH